MKKAICILLSLVLCVSVPVVAFAEDGCDCGNTPVVLVNGIGSPMYAVNEDGSQGALVSVTAEDFLDIAPAVTAALGLLAAGDSVGFAQAVRELVDIFADFMYCNPDGTSVAAIAAGPSTPADPAVHLGEAVAEGSEAGFFDTIYTFHHDWRLDPTATADLLHAYIQEIKAATGHEKVILMAHSQGNVIAISYLSEYGTADVEKVLFSNAAYQGLRLVGQLYTRDISLAGKASAVTSFLDTFMRLQPQQQMLVNVVGMLDEVGLLDVLVGALDLFLEDTLDALYDYVLIDLFATMPGIWAFVPDAYYEQAKEVMLQKEEHQAIIPVIDAYHYGIQMQIDDILGSLEDDGIPFYIVAGYGIDPIPVYEDAVHQCDMLIDTDYMSLGATCAESGELLTFEGDVLPVYFSPDLKVDASTCLYPDRTWFLRYQGHNDLCLSSQTFFADLLASDTQLTVFDDPAYPQFMECENHEGFVPVTEPEEVDERSYFVRFFDVIVQFFKDAFAKLFGEFGL